mmetsp:Transcript_4341/g.13709  ORF Transcript_4341/g.13709 Transcript_4341/m.13709 type:complete len:216 (-) Transcript_4341:114-761(-)
MPPTPHSSASEPRPLETYSDGVDTCTNRATPAAAQPASRFAVASTLAAVCAAPPHASATTGGQVPQSAAQCTTACWPAHSPAASSGSDSSARTKRAAPTASNAGALDSSRPVAVTSAPVAASSCATAPPRKPVAPVTSTRSDGPRGSARLSSGDSGRCSPRAMARSWLRPSGSSSERSATAASSVVNADPRPLRSGAISSASASAGEEECTAGKP